MASAKTSKTGRNIGQNVGSKTPTRRSPAEKVVTTMVVTAVIAYSILLIIAGLYRPYKNVADASSPEEVSVIKVSYLEEISTEVSEEMYEEVFEEVSEEDYSEIEDVQNLHFVEAMDVSEAEIDLLARVIMCEASICDLPEKYYVGNVVLNRVASSDFPNSIEEVIYQGVDEDDPQYESVAVLYDETPPQEYYSIARNLVYGGVRVLDDDIVFQTGFDPSDWATVVFQSDWHYYSKSMYADSEEADSEEADPEEVYSEETDSEEVYSEEVYSE